MRDLLRIAALAYLAAFPLAAAAAPPQEWVAPERASKRANPLPPSPEALAKGQAIFQKSCATCHGSTGAGDGPKAKLVGKKLAPLMPLIQAQSDGALFWKITHGRQKMPSFDSDLSPDQVWQVVDYLRTFKASN